MLLVTFGEDLYTVETGAGRDLAIPLDFSGPQPGFFGAPPAAQAPMRTGGFVGDTRLGGSCNATSLNLIPHCNGTHTECVGHVTSERVTVHSAAPEAWLHARLVTVDPVGAIHCGETCNPQALAEDRVVTRALLAEATGEGTFEALVVRTLPNDETKQARRYDESDPPAYFTREAGTWLVDHEIRHLLVDLPSVDRMNDADLTVHRAFWGMPRDSRALADVRRPYATITEMIYVPDDLVDGDYLLNLQVPAFCADAAPARPVIYPLVPA